MLKLADSLQVGFFSFYRLGPGDQIQGIMLGSKYYLTDPQTK